MCLLWLEFLSLFGGNSIVCRAIPCWFRCNSLFVVICYSLVLLLFLHCEASSSWCCNSSLFLSFWCTPYLFCRFLYFVSCYCNSFIVHLFSTKCQIGFGVAPNFCSCSFGLPFLSVSNASLQNCPSYVGSFFSCTARAYCYKQIPTGVCHSCLFSFLLTNASSCIEIGFFLVHCNSVS